MYVVFCVTMLILAVFWFVKLLSCLRCCVRLCIVHVLTSCCFVYVSCFVLFCYVVMLFVSFVEVSLVLVFGLVVLWSFWFCFVSLGVVVLILFVLCS